MIDQGANGEFTTAIIEPVIAKSLSTAVVISTRRFVDLSGQPSNLCEILNALTVEIMGSLHQGRSGHAPLDNHYNYLCVESN